MLDNPFPAPSLYKLNHISVYFIQIARKSPTNRFFPSGKAMFFFEVIPGVLGCSVNFSITKRFLLRPPVFPDYLSVSCDYDIILECLRLESLNLLSLPCSVDLEDIYFARDQKNQVLRNACLPFTFAVFSFFTLLISIVTLSLK